MSQSRGILLCPTFLSTLIWVEGAKNMVPYMNYKAGGDVRVVLLTSCQSGCDFCHLEGHKDASEIGQLNPSLAAWKTANKSIPLINRLGGAFTDNDVEYCMRIAKNMGLNKLHLTGGEPTLHPNVLGIIRTFTDAGFAVGMTTHGEFPEANLPKFFEAGLSGINFSFHALTPEQYLSMDLVAQQMEETHSTEAALKFASARLQLKLTNIELATKLALEDRRLSIKANCVVQNTKAALEIVKWCNEKGVTLRLQKELNNKPLSAAKIGRIINELNAKPIREDIAIGDSSGSGTEFRYEGGSFKVKNFGEIYISSMCDECPLMGSPKCRERFYGIRIEHERVTTCIDVQNEQTSFTFEEFLNSLAMNSGIPATIREQYSAMRRFTEK